MLTEISELKPRWTAKLTVKSYDQHHCFHFRMTCKEDVLKIKTTINVVVSLNFPAQAPAL